MKKLPEYVVLNHDSLAALEAEVNLFLHGDEWLPVGGVTVFVDPKSGLAPAPRFLQAMVKNLRR